MMTKSSLQTSSVGENTAKRLARLAAVQGLYQIALTQNTAEKIIADFQDHPGALLHEKGENEAPLLVDLQLFGSIVIGVSQNFTSLDEMIAGATDAKVSPERLETLLRAILRAGTYELHVHSHIPANVIINDYVDVTHAFFGAKEPGLVNAVLDKLAKGLR